MNVRRIVSEAARVCNGRGGGHEFAAGATIPSDTKDKFIDVCENLLKA